jgi:cell division protein FtsL
MLQAESSCARDWNAYNMPTTASMGSPVQGTFNQTMPAAARRTVYKVNNKRKFYIKSALIMFGYALILVFLCMKSAALGYQIENLQIDIQNIETANYRLDYQIAEKSSLARVEQVAVAQLGMYKPESKTSLAMAVKSEPVKVAAAAASSTQEKSLSQKIFNTMYSSLSRLAQNDK